MSFVSEAVRIILRGWEKSDVNRNVELTAAEQQPELCSQSKKTGQHLNSSSGQGLSRLQGQ